LRKRQLTVL
nr:Chain C, peptide [Duck Tembusu virus]